VQVTTTLKGVSKHRRRNNCKLTSVEGGDRNRKQTNHPQKWIQNQPNRTLQATIRRNDSGGGLNEEEDWTPEKKSKTDTPDKETVVQRKLAKHHHS
jgi:hypothetical protein